MTVPAMLESVLADYREQAEAIALQAGTDPEELYEFMREQLADSVLASELPRNVTRQMALLISPHAGERGAAS